MNKETYRQEIAEVSVTVTQSQVDAIRTKNIIRSAMRLYDDNKIGVAGALGQADESELLNRAEGALKLGIEYPFEPAEGQPRQSRIESTIEDPGEFVSEVESLMAELSSAHPDFLLSNKVNLATHTSALSNDTGLDYQYAASQVDVSLLAKPKSSVNLFDTFVGFQGPNYTRESVMAIAGQALPAYMNKVQIADGEYPVCFFTDDPTYQIKLMQGLNGLLFGSGGSLFSGKTGEHLFSDRVSIYQTRSDDDCVYEPFFDAEGTVNPEDRVALIKDGTLVSPYTNRAYARKYNLPLTGAARAEYDGVPDLGAPRLTIPDAGKSAAELLDGRQAILVFIAAGGDFTPDGAFASPVQTGYLFDGEKLIGKVPDITISSHLYDMFGDQFVGVSRDDVFPNTASQVFISTMTVAQS